MMSSPQAKLGGGRGRHDLLGTRLMAFRGLRTRTVRIADKLMFWRSREYSTILQKGKGGKERGRKERKIKFKRIHFFIEKFLEVTGSLSFILALVARAHVRWPLHTRPAGQELCGQFCWELPAAQWDAPCVPLISHCRVWSWKAASAKSALSHTEINPPT